MFNSLPDKTIISELLLFYSLKEIAENSNISAKTLIAATSSDFTHFSEIISLKLREFFNNHVIKNSKKINMTELNEKISNSKNVLVNTPDGFQVITKFFKKSSRQIVDLETCNNKIKCSGDHLVESNFGWVAAAEATPGIKILTKNGFETVVSNSKLGSEPVFDFTVDHENSRYWAGSGISSHNSGKSFLSANVMAQAQKLGYHLLVLDSENALDVEYLSKIGVDTSEDRLTYIQVVTIEDVNRICSDFFSGYIKTYGKDNPDAPKTLFVLDSLAMLSTTTEIENYSKDGTIKADMGILAKRRKSMLRLILNNIARLPIAAVFTDHTYGIDPLLGDGAHAITNSTKYSSSIIGIVTKLKLKEDKDVIGIRLRLEAYKTRFHKTGTKIELAIPYNSGMSPFTGLMELLESAGVIAKGTAPGEKSKYVSIVDGEKLVFKEADLTHELCQKLFKHPNATPSREPSDDSLKLEEYDETLDSDYEQPETNEEDI